jgi:hypothetical protein
MTLSVPPVMAPPAFVVQSCAPVAALRAYSCPLDDPTMTAWFTTMGELTKPLSPRKLHRVELLLNDLAVNVPDFRKNPDVELIAGTTSAVKVPSCAPVVAFTEMLPHRWQPKIGASEGH